MRYLRHLDVPGDLGIPLPQPPAAEKAEKRAERIGFWKIADLPLDASMGKAMERKPDSEKNENPVQTLSTTYVLGN